MRAGLCCASETMGADGWPAADVARPVTDACERAHPPMESISAAWQGLTHTDGPDLKQRLFSGENRINVWEDAKVCYKITIKTGLFLEYFYAFFPI